MMWPGPELRAIIRPEQELKNRVCTALFVAVGIFSSNQKVKVNKLRYTFINEKVL
jgi:hypothetical protein